MTYTEQWRRPQLVNPDETILYDSRGPILPYGKHNTVTYQSFWIVLTRPDRYSGVRLYVKHGAGQDNFYCDSLRVLEQTLPLLGDADKWLLLFGIYKALAEEAIQTRYATEASYESAFIEGRLKKRKTRNSSKHKVWIEQPQREAERP